MESVMASRSFFFSYGVTVPATSQRLQLWIPVAHDDAWQRVSAPEIDGGGTLTEDPATGNRMLHAVLAPGAERVLTVRQKITRSARHTAIPAEASYAAGELDGLAKYLQPDARVPLDQDLADLATGSKRLAPVTAARRLFDHLLSEFDYDSGGCTPERSAHLGDLGAACDLRRGTCTEFHGLYTGAARALGIPTRFAFGFNVPAPPGAPAGMIAGYHCWAESFLPTVGWFPVDVTEAWKRKSGDPAFYFGGLDENRVQFTTGRDVALSPQTGLGPVDRFIFPAVEGDGDEAIEVMPELSFESCE